MNELPVIDRPAERCETCRFWSQHDEKPEPERLIPPSEDHPLGIFGRPTMYGYCLRYPPARSDSRVATDHLDWCGEWQAIKQTIVSKREPKFTYKQWLGLGFPKNALGAIELHFRLTRDMEAFSLSDLFALNEHEIGAVLKLRAASKAEFQGWLKQQKRPQRGQGDE